MRGRFQPFRHVSTKCKAIALGMVPDPKRPIREPYRSQSGLMIWPYWLNEMLRLVGVSM